MEDLQNKIIELMDLFDDEQVTTADKIDRPERALEKQAIDDFMKRNPMAGGGMLVQPSADGSRPGYRGKKDVDKINKIKNYINNQGDKIDAFEFKKFAKEVGYKRPRGLIDNLELGFLDNVLGDKTFINKVKRPSKTGFGFSKGQMTVLDKYAKLLNSQQPEKYTSANYLELDDLERANILQRARANDFKFKAKTKFDELTDIQKQKVIEAFGLEQDAFDYDPSKQKNVKGVTKFGVSRDDKRYNQIQRYVKNGFKFSPKDILPIAKQRDIIARFELPEGFEDWDFKKYKYGIPSGGSASNPAYTKRIIDFVGGKTRFPNLAADAGTPQGWMMNQFYRTYSFEKERNVPRNKLTYKPIFETINGKQKVVGFVDNTVSGNGQTYFGIKKWNDKYGGNLLNVHPDFKNVKKFVDISNKAFVEPNKVIMGILQKRGVSPNTKIKFNDVLNFLAEKKGYKATERAIKVHHQSGVGAGGISGEAVKDLQLLRSEVNSSIRQAETRIRNAVSNNLTPNIKDINKLEDLGASIKVGGKIYGAGSQTAIGSFKEIERQVISELQNLKKSDFKKFEQDILNKLQARSKLKECKIPAADGGRIGFANSIKCIEDGLNETRKAAAAGDKKAARQLVETAESASKGGRLLKNVLGPGALLGEAVFEGAIIGNKVLGGKPLKQAWAESYLSYLDPRKYSGKLDPTLLQREQMLESTADKNILQSGFDAQDRISAFNEARRKEELAEIRQRPDQLMTEAEREKLRAYEKQSSPFIKDSQLQKDADIISSEAFKDASNVAQEYLQGQEGQRMFPYNQFKQSIGKFESGEARDFRRQKEQEMKNLYTQFSDTQLMDMLENSKSLKAAGITPEQYMLLLGAGTKRITPAVTRTLSGLDAVRTDIQEQEALNRIAEAGGVANLARGGRAGFKLGKLVKLKKSKVREDAKAIIDDSMKMQQEIDTTAELDKLIKKTLDEDFFDKKDRIIDNINAKIARAKAKGLDSKEIAEGQIDFYDSIIKSNFKTKTGPFFDYQKRKNKAGGGILKQAGDRSGPPPESGPNPQGLQGLLNRVKKG
jgi:hypothetical protein